MILALRRIASIEAPQTFPKKSSASAIASRCKWPRPPNSLNEVGRRKTCQARLAWMMAVVAIPLSCQNCSGENRLESNTTYRIITGRSQENGQIQTRVSLARWLQTCPKYSRKNPDRLHPKACVPPNPCVLRHSCEASLLSAPPLASAGTTRMEPSPRSPQEIVLFAETFVAAQIEEPKLSHATSRAQSMRTLNLICAIEESAYFPRYRLVTSISTNSPRAVA